MLKVQDLRLRYRTDEGEVEAVRGLSLNVERGQFYTLLGPSGCGKTSTLRCIAGLETPNSGLIEIDSTVVYASASRTLIPPHKRNIGMVFQSYAIWPHMTVFDNVAFPLVHGSHKQPKNVVKDKVMRALTLVQLEHVASRPAPMLSGGQQQRVALARAIASEPAVLLLDEPLSNLDAKLREDMRQEIKSLVKRLDTTTLYVTHDQLEALSMSDRVALVNEGVIVQEGGPRDVYLNPADSFAANFLGRTNLLEGRVTDHPDGQVETRWGMLRVALPTWASHGRQVTVGFRPESVVLSESAAHTDGLMGKIAAASFVGDAVEYQIDLGGRAVRAKGQPFIVLDEGHDVLVRVPPERCYVLDTASM
ncbi:MAG TPA: ABC transporter ATP-binding protein [Chloroflexota bacterium]|jgi:iron(III) transport system ATP-binding protein|nr:ABC transporter ATP-binding protein [Chloroflexota bacterium]